MNKNLNQHWSTEDLIGRLYGVGPEAPGAVRHFEGCAGCQARWEELQLSRAEVVAPPAVSDDLLRRQRHDIFARLERRAASWLPARALQIGATALVFTVGILLQLPEPTPPPSQAVVEQPELSDAQLFAEFYSVAREDSPRAVAPIRGLFGETE